MFINTIIIVFLVLFIIQAFRLYQQSGKSELRANRKHDVLQQIRLVQNGVRDMEMALQDYLITGKEEYKQILADKADDAITNASYLTKITLDDPEQYQRAVSLHDLIRQKKNTALHLIQRLDNSRTRLQSLRDPETDQLRIAGKEHMDELLALMESTEQRFQASGTSENKYYSRTGIAYSVLGFFLFSVFLSFSLYKIQQSIYKKILTAELAGKEQAKYRALVEHAGVTTLLIDKRGVVRFVSKNIQDLAGYTHEDIVHQPFYEKVAREYRSYLYHAIFDDTSGKSYNTSAEIQIQTATGDLKWVSCRIFPAGTDPDSSEWQVVLWDIEAEKKKALEYKALETAHKERLKITQEIIDHIPFVLYLKDRNGIYLMVNRKTEEVFNLPAVEIIGKTTEQVLKNTPERLRLYKQTDQDVIEQGKIVELEEIQSQEKDYYYRISKFPLMDREGTVQYIGVLAADITVLKETELSLIASRKEAEQAKAAQEMFLANMSHEIRTPMNGIIGMTNLLISTSLDEEQRDFAASIQESAQNLLSIINDLLDFSKIKSGKFQFEHITFNPRDTIRKAIYPLQFKAEEKMIRLSLSVDGTVPEILSGDPLRLQQVIINLAGNALKFTSEGNVDIFMSGEKRSARELVLSVSVKDTGTGIAADKLEEIFESFSQSKTEDARKYGGSGLGLAIVKQLVELQDGTIEVASTVGKGSVFSFSIPYDVPEKGQEIQMLSTGSGSAFAERVLLRNMRILAAEDNLINQKVVKNLLSRQGASITVVSNGQEAIQKVKQSDFDIMLMDLQMPEVNGYKATKYIREVMKSNIPIIAMTADALKGEEEKCYEAGMNGYISKPFEPGALYAQIAKLAGNHHEMTEAHHAIARIDDTIVDFSLLKEITENNGQQIYEILNMFVDTMPDGLETLNTLIRQADDFEAIARQAHFLKSSVSVVKIKHMYERLAEIERLANQQDSIREIDLLIKRINDTYQSAESVLIAEKEKNRSTQV